MLISNLEMLLNELKDEVYPEVNPYKYEEVAPYLVDDDIEFYEEED